MKVLVAGAAGTMGRVLVPLLVEAGHEVVGTTRQLARVAAIRTAGAEPVVVDAFDRTLLRDVVAAARPDAVVHQLTSLPRALDPRRIERDLAENDRLRSEATPSLVDAAVAAGARRVVAQSIAFAYPPGGTEPKREDDPLWLDAPWPWRRSVQAIADLERAVTETPGIDGVVLRYGLWYGPGTAYARDGAVAAQVRRRRLPVVGRGAGISSFLHVEDAASATVLALDRGSPGVYNVVDDEPAPMRDWVPAFADALGAPRPRRVPAWLARLAVGGWAIELATRQRAVSNDKARRELGWEPKDAGWREGFRRDLADGLA